MTAPRRIVVSQSESERRSAVQQYREDVRRQVAAEDAEHDFIFRVVLAVCALGGALAFLQALAGN